MFPVTRFALARYAPRMLRQKGEVIEFYATGIRVWAGSKVLEDWAHEEVQRLVYKHFPRSISRAFQMLSGSLLHRRDAIFSLELEGRRQDFYLEADAEFRQVELRKLMRGLYLSGVNLEEYSGTGSRLFLLESANGTNISAAVEALREKGEKTP